MATYYYGSCDNFLVVYLCTQRLIRLSSLERFGIGEILREKMAILLFLRYISICELNLAVIGAFWLISCDNNLTMAKVSNEPSELLFVSYRYNKYTDFFTCNTVRYNLWQLRLWWYAFTFATALMAVFCYLGCCAFGSLHTLGLLRLWQ